MITIQPLFTILVIILSLTCHLASAEKAIRCKYVLIEKSYYQKVQSQSTIQTNGDSNSNSFFFQKQFNFGISGRVELLKSHLVRWHVDDCLNSNILDRIDVVNNVFRSNSDSVDSRQFSLYGVDLSSNQLTDNEFESILNTNPLFRYNPNLIKYLNLATNKLVHLNSNISRFNDELDEFNFLNDESTSFLRPNQTGYLLGRFFNLETLVVDDNSLLSVSVADLMAVLPKLKVLSASRCSPTIAQRQIVHSSINPKSLVYLGLSGNKISDPTLDDYLPTRQLNVDSLDLSFNKLSNLTNVLARLARVNRLNLEKNLIEALRVGDIISLEVSKSISEINLRSNFIQNTSVENFKFDDKSTNIRPIGFRLAGNPLICDCQSIWLLDLVKDMIINSQQPQAQTQQPQTPRTQILNRKRPKSSSNGDHIKLVYRRDMEVISYYHNIDQDPNLTTFMQRQKRLNATGSSQEKKLELLAAKFLDLDQLTCSFIDVQDSQYSSHHQQQKRSNSQQLVNIERSPQTATDYDMSSSLDYFIADSTGPSNQEPIEIKQKLNVGSIRYREKLLSSSTHQDFMCQYDDHCRLDLDCDCCVFQHCHCRSICPSKCRCYFDASKSQNIIDCSQSNLIDVPSDQPIESATDMRLNSNNLKMLKAYAFFGYGSIKYLYLQDNQISAVNRNAFDDLKPTLRVINLANNQLDYLHGDEFKGFVDLEVIVLSHNPLKQIESFSFLVAADSLPKLKLLYASKTQLGSEQMTKLTVFAKANSNATVKFRERRLLLTSSAPSNIASKVALGPINKSAEEYAINNSTSLSKRRQQQQELTTPKTIINIEETRIEEQTESETESTNTWDSKPPMRSPLDFLPLNSLLTTNIYIISGSIIVVCLLLSLFILSIVMCIIRRIERGQKRRRRDRRSKSDKKKSGKHVVENGALSYYITSPEDDELSSSDDDENDDSSSEDETSTASYRGGKRWLSCFCRRSAPNSFDASSPSSSYFDSTSSSSSNAAAAAETATDAASVPVSRSLEHTSLYVYVYFSEFDAHYANNYLLPCLHKCLTIVPDTRFVMCSQRDKYAWDEAAAAVDSTPDSIRTTSRSTSIQRRTAATTKRLVARILVVSENFFGLRLNAESCLTSSSSSDRSLVTAKIASASNPHHHNHRANNKHLNIFRIYLFNNNINGTMINSNGQQTNDSNNSSNSGEIIATTTSSSNKLNSFNKRLMRRLFETSPTQTTMNGTHNPNHHYQHSISTNNRLCSSQAIATMNQLNIMNNMNYPNDAFSSYAYYDRLQCKLEKFLEYVCLKKSNSFSKTTNFSYVDYTKTKR